MKVTKKLIFNQLNVGVVNRADGQAIDLDGNFRLNLFIDNS